LRRLCKPTVANANAVTAASAAARPANVPNWTAHLVGVNVSSSRPSAVLPINRHSGPRAMPPTRPLRSSIISMANMHSSIARIANRRVSDASGCSSTVRK
jgi:hypothetical protein